MGLALALTACLASPPAHAPAMAQLVITWDPLACGDPHRVAVELADDAGAQLAGSAPCDVGVVALDVAAYGSYSGRTYAWAIGEPIRSIAPLAIDIGEPEVRQSIATPL
jgi:hypothetical protein